MTRRPTIKRRKGVVLIIVLVVVIVLALAAYTFSDLMVAHRRVAAVNGKQLQARMLVQSGVEKIKQYLATDEATRLKAGGHFINPAYFQTAVVIPEQDPLDRGCFTVVAPYFDELGLSSGGVRYGLEDESSRLNMNVLLIADTAVPNGGRTLLMSLPGMTEDIADAILDWIDAEDEPKRDYGAEFSDYYATLSPAYEPRNGPLQTVEELLLVKGVTPELLFGADFNRNGMIDQHEQTMSTSLGLGTATAGQETGTVNRGWSAYLTLYSSERNANSEGVPRIDLNNENLQELHDELSELSGVFNAEQANFIVAFRLYEPPAQNNNNNGQAQSAADLKLDLTQSPKKSLTQVLDLIGASVEIPGANGQPATVVNSPFQDSIISMATYMTTLMDNCTISKSETIPGRININEAPRELLLGIPAVNTTAGDATAGDAIAGDITTSEPIMTEELADQIIELRTAVDEDNAAARSNETWLLAEAVVDLDQMKALTPFICGGGDVFRCQIVGYFQGGGPSSRAEVVFDATGTEPRELLWRDISHLGRGYALETLGVDLLEAVVGQ